MAKKGRAVVTAKALREMEKAEPDVAWRLWFDEVRRRREALASVKRRPLVVSRFEVEGEVRTVCRQRGEPMVLKSVLKKRMRDMRLDTGYDLVLLQEAWERAVGGEVGGETGVFSFKGGVLTVEVYSGGLLQELRMFHAGVIERDLRDIWPLKLPLASIRYKLGKRKKLK